MKMLRNVELEWMRLLTPITPPKLSLSMQLRLDSVMRTHCPMTSAWFGDCTSLKYRRVAIISKLYVHYKLVCSPPAGHNCLNLAATLVVRQTWVLTVILGAGPQMYVEKEMYAKRRLLPENLFTIFESAYQDVAS